MKRISYDDIFWEEDPLTSYDMTGIFYEDENLEIPFNGIVFDNFKGVLNWEFEVKNGFMEGIERTYYEETGELEQELERKRNFIDGLQKTFYKSGKLHFISISIKYVDIYSVWYDEDGNIIKKEYISEEKLNSPSYTYIKDNLEIYMEKYKHIKELDLN